MELGDGYFMSDVKKKIKKLRKQEPSFEELKFSRKRHEEAEED